MRKLKHLTLQERTEIGHLWSKGVKTAEIAREFGVDKVAVNNVIQFLRINGLSIASRKKSKIMPKIKVKQDISFLQFVIVAGVIIYLVYTVLSLQGVL